MKLIIANWKMQLTSQAALRLARQISRLSFDRQALDLVLCPSFTALAAIGQLKRPSYALGAQDMFWVKSGAYTGEISPLDLKEAGCQFVIIGHSERRQFLRETDEIVSQKVQTALEIGLRPILCIGEKIEEREAKQEKQVVSRQLTAVIDQVGRASRGQLIIAYEPVWAIGTGRTPKPAEIQKMHNFICSIMRKTKLTCQVIYGGSVDAGNILDFISLPEVDGALVGGASSDFKKFKALLETLNPKP